MAAKNAGVIRSVRATPVRVPAKPDSLNSPGVDDSDAAFAARFRTGARWADFPLEVKWVIELRSAGGTRGCGETYRGVTAEELTAIVPALLGVEEGRRDVRRRRREHPLSDEPGANRRRSGTRSGWRWEGDEGGR